MAQAAVQRDIQARVDGYPEKAGTTHHAHCYIPACLAAVLDANPSLVAPMVQAFYYRDPIDLKSCITFHHFRPGTRVMRSVQFTRCLYAQLSQQRFTPDKRSGYTMPASSNPKYTAYDLGTKLAHGAEILCSRCGSIDTSVDPMKKVTSDPRWSRYVATLNAKGYFKGELEGSRLYNKLLEDAKKYFINSFGSDVSTKTEVSPGEEICRLSKQVHYDIEEMRKQEKTLQPADDDRWLEIDPSELDAMLEKASGKRINSAGEGELNDMTRGVKTFINKVSSHTGAEIPTLDDNEVQFDPNSFMQSMQKVFDFGDSDDGNSSSDLSEYGSDDDEMEEYTPRNKSQKSTGSRKHAPTNGDADNYLGLQDYMDIMDRELANTKIGDSFQKFPANKKDTSPSGPVAPPRRKKQAKNAASQSASSSTSSSNQSTPQHLGHAPSKGRAARHAPKARMDDEDIYDVDDLDEDFQPVNVDLNLVQNLMESYNSQGGLAGPASNLLGSMGIRVPQDRGRQSREDF